MVNLFTKPCAKFSQKNTLRDFDTHTQLSPLLKKSSHKEWKLFEILILEIDACKSYGLQSNEKNKCDDSSWKPNKVTESNRASRTPN